MTDRPIIFSAPMVRALLDGRKTQTRRIIKPPRGVDPNHWMPDAPGSLGVGINGDRVRVIHWPNDGAERAFARLPCGIGDRLWVREGWCPNAQIEAVIHYRADGAHVVLDDGDGFTACRKDGSERSACRSPLFMPRWASRLTLVVTDFRVQRLQVISDEDVKAEGCLRTATNLEAGVDGYWAGEPQEKRFFVRTRKEAFAALWNDLHGPDAWEANPWVAAITFTVHRANIDAIAPSPVGVGTERKEP